MQTTKKISIFLAIGFFLVGTALYAEQVGLSFGGGWGKSRMAILIVGLLLALIPWVTRKPAAKISQSDLFALPALLIVLAVYFWFLSVSHNSSSGYYALLANSFREGKLSLSLRPDPALLELANPYDPAARQGIKAPLDLSLYKGKFYLYWGAAPALLVALAKPLLPGEISDGYLLLAFVSGIFLLEFLLIMHLWERYLPAIPRWIVILSILVAGLINPTLWLLSQPKIYETAIAGGQFFFMAGLFSVITGLARPAPSAWRLAWAGIFWSLAVGTRSVLLFPIVFMTLVVLAWFYKLHGRSFVKLITALMPLGVPLMIGAIVFAWYNWARFGSISETGFSYALAGPYLQEHLNELFLPAYSFQNFFNYLFNPFTVRQNFPFLFPIRGQLQAMLPWQVLPEIYSAQAITGILFAAPFTVFAGIPIARLFFKKDRLSLSDEERSSFSFRWILSSLVGSFLLSFACLLIFFWTAMRYAEDFMPTFTLLATIGFWQGVQTSSSNPNKGKMYTGLGLILAGVSIVAGIFLALSIYFTNGLL